jgi:hypothetical protein
VAAALLLAGCTGPEWSRKGDATIGPGGFYEANFKLGAGQSVHWTWSTDAGRSISFNVHFHESNIVVDEYHLYKDSDTHSYKAVDAREYSLLWENDGNDTIHLHYDLHGEGEYIDV